MICDINYTNPYFTIEKVSRKIRKRFAFVGKIEQDIKSILDKLKNKEKIDSKYENILQKKFGETSKSWYNLKSNTEFYYIEDKIYLNDTLYEIKKKVCSYLSDNTNSPIVPINQQYWFATKNNK